MFSGQDEKERNVIRWLLISWEEDLFGLGYYNLLSNGFRILGSILSFVDSDFFNFFSENGGEVVSLYIFVKFLKY